MPARRWLFRLQFEIESFDVQESEIEQRKEHPMSRLGKAIQSHRETSRARRELSRATTNAATPTMRDELFVVAQRSGGLRPRS